MEFKIVSAVVDEDSFAVLLKVKDQANHTHTVELLDTSVDEWILDEAWDEMGLDNDPDIEKLSDDAMLYTQLQALAAYLDYRDVATLEWSDEIGGVKLVDCKHMLA